MDHRPGTGLGGKAQAHPVNSSGRERRLPLPAGPVERVGTGEVREGLVTCRAGLENVVKREVLDLGVEVLRVGRRAVFFRTDTAGVYRLNMALRAAIQVLLPLRTFNARNYDMLYFQSRKTPWHRLFGVDRTIRIDVNGGSDALSHTEYVVHRVKDGIVDTFRKLSGGRRPSIDKRQPEVHLVVHLDGPRVTLCLDTSGIPLFKRGYRETHGGAPLKEDLAAGMLLLSGWDGRAPLLDPMCGSGTFLFEGWMIAAGIPPNLDREFAFKFLHGYCAETHLAERQALRASIRLPRQFSAEGWDIDPEVCRLAGAIRRRSFPEAPMVFREAAFQKSRPPEGSFLITNPPYGVRIGQAEAMQALYAAFGRFLRDAPSLSGCALYTANQEAAASLGLPVRSALTLFNGALEGQLLRLR